MHNRTITLDVCEDLRQGRVPLERIVAAAGGLAGQQALRLLAPLEPVPLIGLLGRKGFAHVTRQLEDELWEVVFTRAQVQPSGAAPAPASAAAFRPESGARELDLRGLEPPEPMIRVLEAAEALPAGGSLRARTERRPLHLLAELTARGFVHQTQEQPDGIFVTQVARA